MKQGIQEQPIATTNWYDVELNGIAYPEIINMSATFYLREGRIDDITFIAVLPSHNQAHKVGDEFVLEATLTDKGSTGRFKVKATIVSIYRKCEGKWTYVFQTTKLISNTPIS